MFDPSPIEFNSSGYKLKTDQYIHVCQSCGQHRIYENVESGSPKLISGHRTRNCPKIDQYVVNFITHPFGLVIPHKGSGIIYEFQTNSMMCSKRLIRGYYVDLHPPLIRKDSGSGKMLQEYWSRYDEQYEPTEDSLINIVQQIRRRNYQLNLRGSTTQDYYYKPDEEDQDEMLEYLWSIVRQKLPFDYNVVDPPSGYPETEEAFKWIKITNASSEKTSPINNATALEEEKVVLVYPNCD